MPRVFVTGMGIISALGKNLRENHHALKIGTCGIGMTHHLESEYAKTYQFGEVKLSDDELRTILDEYNEHFTRTDLLAFKAFEEAVNDAGLTEAQIQSIDTAFISASTVGGMVYTTALFEDANLKSSGSPYLQSYGCGAHTVLLSEKYGIKGYTDTINTACSSSANAIMLGTRLIKSGRVKRAIVGGTDGLSKFAINGFNALQILSDVPCKPFDDTRIGLSMGEGAAYLVLESEEETGEKERLAEVVGYGNGNDAFHPSSMSEEAVGVRKVIAEALKTAGISGDQVDYINAHGTATENNDKIEIRGIQAELGTIPPYNSTKSYTGHTLGAAGSIEAVFSILSMRNGEFYASLNCEQPMEEFGTPPIHEYVSGKSIAYVLSNSFGFAGNCTSLLFKNGSDVH